MDGQRILDQPLLVELGLSSFPLRHEGFVE
jgi:hypothetical protein